VQEELSVDVSVWWWWWSWEISDSPWWIGGLHAASSEVADRKNNNL